MMRNVIVTRDRMIHRLSTTNELLTDEQRELLITSLQEFAVEAENLGLPLIPQEIIEGFLKRTRPHKVLTEVTFPQEFNLQNDENFDVQPPIITLTDRILEHYHIPTWEV